MSLPKQTILIVDDHKSVRDSLERVLRLENFDVLLAGCGKDALREALRAKIDIVLLDLNLGTNDDGWDTLDALLRISPSLPILVMTGEAPRLAHSSASRAAALLLKPITNFPYLLSLLGRQQTPGHASKDVLAVMSSSETNSCSCV